jgi:hypothetical protein
MIEWQHAGHAWLDIWTSRCGSAMITRHPRHDRGEYVVWIGGERVGSANEFGLAEYKAKNLMTRLETST